MVGVRWSHVAALFFCPLAPNTLHGFEPDSLVWFHIICPYCQTTLP